jgi:hypothetical protein
VHLFFIYTKKKIGKILGNGAESLNALKTKELSPKKVEKKSEESLKTSVPNVPNVFTKWIEYCDKNGVKYGKSNIKYWEKKLENRLTIEQEEAVYNAINKKLERFLFSTHQRVKIS